MTILPANSKQAANKITQYDAWTIWDSVGSFMDDHRKWPRGPKVKKQIFFCQTCFKRNLSGLRFLFLIWGESNILWLFKFCVRQFMHFYLFWSHSRSFSFSINFFASHFALERNRKRKKRSDNDSVREKIKWTAVYCTHNRIYKSGTTTVDSPLSRFFCRFQNVF